MKSSGKRTFGRWFLPAIVSAVLLAWPVALAQAQGAASATKDAPAASAAAADATKGPAAEGASAKSDDKSAEAANGTPSLSSAAGGNSKASDSKSSDSAAATGEEAAAAATPVSGVSPWMMGVLIVALFVLPVMAGNYLAKLVRMPDYGWKISLVLFMITAGSVIVALGQFKFGPDLAGGITLIYEVEDANAGSDAAAPNQPAAALPPGAVSPKKAQMDKLIGALRKRIDPTSTKEITIRPQGSWAVEIIIPRTGPDALESVKRRITALGELEFRITADPLWPADRPKIERAKLAPPNEKDVLVDGKKVGEWVEYDPKAFGKNDETIVKRMAGNTPEAFVLMDDWNVTGDYLANADKGVDERGGPAVHFSFDSQGAKRFRQLTGSNLQNQATGAYRHLGILLDKILRSAPRIQSVISDQGQISGAMTDKEVEDTVSVLNAGSLPAKLNKTPISQTIISPTLGAATIQHGEWAIVISFFSIVLFMLFYYRLSGLIAVGALFINLIIVLAAMIMIKAAFTLPGLAGLVLTIGIAVDANVLIFERMREELRNGAALRMAIRNGFGRATRTIIDANMTTIISAVVMYTAGRDQIKGFAITLILGVLVSMFTAIFCSRIVFDILERRGWITTLKMNSIIGKTNIDFMGWQYWAIGTSWVLILIGMVGCYFRGSSLLNIDFTGGSTVTFVLDSNHPKPITDVQNALDKTELAGKNLLVVRNGESDTRYTVTTSEQRVDEVKKTIVDTFGADLSNYSVDSSDLKPFSEGGQTGTDAKVLVNSGLQFDNEDGASHDALLDWIKTALPEEQRSSVTVSATNPNYRPGSSVRFKEWAVRLVGLDPDGTRAVLDKVKTTMDATPMFPLANQIGGRVSTGLQIQAIKAIVLSCLGIIAYLWLRFQKISFGLAAVLALLHDVFITVGMVALSAYFVNLVPGLAKALQIDSFQISLEIVAALLTIIGYSVNDTIIVFDRLREVRGKSPDLTKEMINSCVNQTLSRTLLTAFTVFLVVMILYWFGGEGVHGFAFCMVIGVFVGCYSSIYIAAPILYWLIGTDRPPASSATSKAA